MTPDLKIVVTANRRIQALERLLAVYRTTGRPSAILFQILDATQRDWNEVLRAANQLEPEGASPSGLPAPSPGTASVQP